MARLRRGARRRLPCGDRVTEPPRPGTVRTAIGRSDALKVAVAAALGSIGGYVVLVIATRSLTQAQNAEFLVFWSALFLAFGVLGGVQNEVTRTVSTGAGERAAAPGTPVFGLALGIGAASAVLVLATSPWWGEALLGGLAVPLVPALAVGVLCFAGHAAAAGTLAGRRQWATYALVVGGEGTSRPVLAGLAAATGAGAAGLGWAAAGAAATWIVLLALPAVRRTTRARSALSSWRLAATSGQAMVAAASSSVLLVGFAVLLSLTAGAAEAASAAPLVLAVTLTRAPVMIPLQAFQGVAITHVVAHRDRGLLALAPVLIALAAGTAVVAGVAWVAGRPVMAALFGPENTVGGSTLAGLVAASGLLALVTVTGAAALALGEHRRYAVGWLAATGGTVAVLLTDVPLEARVVTALCAGPLVGVVLHTWRRRRTPGEDR